MAAVNLTQNQESPAIVLTDPDTDFDTLPDWWEMATFDGLAGGPDTDTDGDGFDDGYECRHGTDPELAALPLFPRWNLVSIQHLPADNAVATLLGDAITGPVWGWANGDYLAVDELLPVRGHWAYRGSETMVELPPTGGTATSCNWCTAGT